MAVPWALQPPNVTVISDASDLGWSFQASGESGPRGVGLDGLAHAHQCQGTNNILAVSLWGSRALRDGELLPHGQLGGISLHQSPGVLQAAVPPGSVQDFVLPGRVSESPATCQESTVFWLTHSCVRPNRPWSGY